MKSSGSLQKDHPADAAHWRRVWLRRARTAGAHALQGACTAIGATAVSLLVWWIQTL
jgi:hypothetical protein